MHGHEGRVERALAEDPAKEVGEPEGHEKGVCDQARTQRRRNQRVAHETEQSRQRGRAADEKHRFGERHRVSGPGGCCFDRLEFPTRQRILAGYRWGQWLKSQQCLGRSAFSLSQDDARRERTFGREWQSRSLEVRETTPRKLPRGKP